MCVCISVKSFALVQMVSAGVLSKKYSHELMISMSHDRGTGGYERNDVDYGGKYN